MSVLRTDPSRRTGGFSELAADVHEDRQAGWRGTMAEDVSGIASDSGNRTGQQAAVARRDRLVWQHSDHCPEALPDDD